MTAALRSGPAVWGGERDDEGQRTWNVKWRVYTDDVDDGPAVVMLTPGLPTIGSIWSFGNDLDSWAFCTPWMKVTVHGGVKEGDAAKEWTVEQKFSTKPFKRCQDESIEDPLLEPDRISGTFVKMTKEATTNRWGSPIVNPAHELLRGPQVEFDEGLPTVSISQNVATLGLAYLAQAYNCVNDAAMWGLSARCIKLSNLSWERKVYAKCDFYYVRNFDFDINYNTFDRDLPAKATKVLHGHWDTTTGSPTLGQWVLDNIAGSAPSKTNPSHFDQATDRNGNPIEVFLDNDGKPVSSGYYLAGYTTGTASGGEIANIHVEKYDEFDFLFFGIPAVLEI